MEARDRVGVMVVRVWVEPGPAPTLRARLTTVDDILEGGDRTVELAAVDPVTIAGEVEGWLRRWMAATSPSDEAE